MPKLLQINSTCNVGSTGKIAEGIGRLAIEAGWDSIIAYGRSYSPSKSQIIKIGSSISVYNHILVSRIFDKHGLGSIGATERFIKLIDTKLKPDIIHLHNIHGYYLNYSILFQYLRSRNIPIVWTMHDCWPFTGHCAYFDRVSCCKWEIMCENCPQLLAYPRSWGRDNSKYNFLSKKSSFLLHDRMFVVPVSYWLDSLLKKSFLKNIPRRVIHNGIDIKLFSPNSDLSFIEKYNLQGKNIILGVASPWSERKGLGDFFKLRELLPVHQYAIVLVGLSPSQIRDLPQGIVGIQRTSSIKELANIYSSASVFVNTTYEENYPTVNLEAISCGTPVITYNTGGSPESVTSDTGFVIKQGDIKALVNAIKYISQKGKLFYSLKCRSYAEANFDQSKCFEQYIDLYNELLIK